MVLACVHREFLWQVEVIGYFNGYSCLLVTFQEVIEYFEVIPMYLNWFKTDVTRTLWILWIFLLFVTPWRSSCEQGYKPVSDVFVWMLVWMPFSYRSCRSRRATELLGSPCKGPRASLWLGLCECFVRVNVLFQWATDSTKLPSYPISSLFIVLSFRAFFGFARDVWITCILSYFSFWPFLQEPCEHWPDANIPCIIFHPVMSFATNFVQSM